MVVDLTARRGLRRLSRAQNRQFRYAQLLQGGLTRSEVRAMLKRGRLVYRGHAVYAAGDPALLPCAAETTAVLSLSPGAVLTHRSAAALRGLAQPDPDVVDVTLPGRQARPRPGVCLHRTQRLDRADIETLHNLPVTALARTLIDFASQATDSAIRPTATGKPSRPIASSTKPSSPAATSSSASPGASFSTSR